MLPAEILLRVFEYAHDDRMRPSSGYVEPGNVALLSITLTCSSWRTLAEPLLYRKVQVDFESYHSRASQFESLRRSLREQPHRNNFVSELHLTCSDQTHVEYSNEILTNLRNMTNLQTVTVGQHWRAQVNPAIWDQICSMTTIKNLVSYSEATDYILKQHLPTGFDNAFSALRSWRLGNASPLLRECDVPASKCYTWGLEDIEISYNCHAETIYELLKLVKALKRLSLDIRFDRCAYSDSYTCASIQKFLNLHSHSLEHLSLPGYNIDNSHALPDLKGFASLRYLQLNQSLIFKSDAESAVARLCSPYLETFHIDMDEEDQQHCIHRPFNKIEAQWVLDFVTRYRKLDQRFSLRTIHIDYYWGDQSDWYYCPFENPWPNTYMASLRPKIVELGLDLTWSTPPLSEEEWRGPERRRRCDDAQQQIYEWRNHHLITGYAQVMEEEVATDQDRLDTLWDNV